LVYSYDNKWHPLAKKKEWTDMYPSLEHPEISDIAEKIKSKAKGFKTGGLADFTGPAWLDGTKTRPEYVLNAAQTERFFSLVDVLEGIDTNSASAGASGGDNHFEIEINVDKLENDYDVEQLADKIRRMMYDDASYRNVKAIGLMR
jgi:hypothetical protein